jgi:hypothetical protein
MKKLRLLIFAASALILLRHEPPARADDFIGCVYALQTQTWTVPCDGCCNS